MDELKFSYLLLLLLLIPNLLGGGKDLETAAAYGQNSTNVATTTAGSIGINSPFLAQPIKIEIPTLPATSKTVQPLRFPKVNTANNRVPLGASPKPRKLSSQS